MADLDTCVKGIIPLTDVVDYIPRRDFVKSRVATGVRQGL